MDRALKINRYWLYLVIALLCSLPFAFLFYQAWYSPKIEFLIPSLRGDWILRSAEKISGTVDFRRRFQIKNVPTECKIKVRAMSQFTIAVNEQIVEADSQREQHNWKRPRTYNIAPTLQEGDNAIVIRVSNPEGPPALLVEGPNLGPAEGKTRLSSDKSWESASDPEFKEWAGVVFAFEDGARLGERKGPVQKSPRYPFYLMIFGAYILFIIIAINPLRIFRKSGSEPQTHFSGLPRWLSLIPFLAIIGIVVVVNVHNSAVYPYNRGFDWGGHAEYIKYMAAKWRTPIATEGWEMFQPPFYYFLFAIVYKLFGGTAAEPNSLRALQFFGTFSGIANTVFAWLVLRKLFRNNYSVQLLGFSVVAFLPMCFYMNPLISNAVFSGSIISLAIYLLIRYGFEERIKIHHALILGAVFGLALLSKYTAMFILLTAATVLAIRVIADRSTRRREVTVLAIFLVVALAMSGWVYIRNLVEFHDPFIGNWDRISGYHYEQHHGYRTLGFYLKFGSVFLHAPERSRWASFWDGKYGSMWMDTHGTFLGFDSEKANLYGSIIIYLALLPSVATLLGFCQSLKSAFKSARCNPDLALVMVCILTFISLISFTMEVPFFSTIKAFFYVSLLPAIAVFAGKGLYTMSRNLGKFRFTVYANLTVLYLLIVKLFWYRG